MLNTIMLFAILTGGQPMKPATNWHSDPIGSTHGGVVVLDDGRVLVNTDTAEGTVVLSPDGTKAGTIYGKSDTYGNRVAENEVHVHDFHATILHLLGIDHERLTYKYQGRHFRLTDVHGHVVKPILA